MLGLINVILFLVLIPFCAQFVYEIYVKACGISGPTAVTHRTRSFCLNCMDPFNMLNHIILISEFFLTELALEVKNFIMISIVHS